MNALYRCQLQTLCSRCDYIFIFDGQQKPGPKISTMALRLVPRSSALRALVPLPAAPAKLIKTLPVQFRSITTSQPCFAKGVFLLRSLVLVDDDEVCVQSDRIHRGRT